MKKLIVFLIFTINSFCIFSQAPLKFDYSAVVRDVSGNPVFNQTVGFQIKILSGSPSGTVEYMETHSVATDNFGVATFLIGGGTPVSGSMSSIVWGTNSFYIDVAVDINGGSAYNSVSTTQLVSVPYALYANEAGSVAGSPWTVSGNNIYNNNSGNVGIGNTNPFGKLSVKQDSTMFPTIPLFSVKNRYGQDVFVIYPDSVRIYINDGSKTNKGSVIISGRNLSKAYSGDYMRISPDSTQFYGNTQSTNIAFNRPVASYPIHIGVNATNGNGAYLTPGGVWTNSSSKGFKDRFTTLPGQDILDKISAMNIQGWYYKGTNEYHIGPVAEDFYQAFGCGLKDRPDDVKRYIAPSDVAGVSIIAVQELNDQIKAEKQKNLELSEENESLRIMIESLRQRVENLESR